MTMLKSVELIRQILLPLYGLSETRIMSDMLLEKITGQRSGGRADWGEGGISEEQEKELQRMLGELERHRPVQYVIGEAWFQGMKFKVDERVLIPRPETEELVEWVIKDVHSGDAWEILDIGTGSGCIPISLKKRLPVSLVHSCDISEGALTLAKENADKLGADIHFFQADILDRSSWGQLPRANVIVSNPPYIPQSGRSGMDPHVVAYEPATALFVPDNNPYLFYEAIAGIAMSQGITGTRIYVEIHEDLAAGVHDCFARAGLTDITIRRDMQGKERMVRAFTVR